MAGQRVALDRMHDVLRGSHCAGEILAGYYRTHWQGGVLSTGVNCRSCPWCRANRAAEYDDAGMCQVAGEPFPAVHSWPGRGRDPLADIRGSSSWLSIWWGNRQERDDLLPQLLERLVRRGMSVIGGPGVTARLAAQVQELAWPSPVIVDYDDDLVTTFPGPVIWVLGDTTRSLDRVILGRLKSTDVTYLLHPRSLPAPDRPEIGLAKVATDRFPSTPHSEFSDGTYQRGRLASVIRMGGGALPAVGRRAVPGRTRAGTAVPPDLAAGERRATFNDAVGTLKDLALITDDDGELSLSPAARELSPDDVAGFSDLLRRAVLGQAQNTGLDGSGDQTENEGRRRERPGPRASLVPHPGRVHPARPG